jgi:hypothetical protein
MRRGQECGKRREVFDGVDETRIVSLITPHRLIPGINNNLSGLQIICTQADPRRLFQLIRPLPNDRETS